MASCICFLVLFSMFFVFAAGEIMEENELVGLFEVMDSLLDDTSWGEMHPLPCTDTPWPGVQCEIAGDLNSPIFHITKIHIGPDILSPPCCKFNATLSSKALLKLPYLKTLSLFNCFTGSPVYIPSTLFGTFSTLELLALRSNPTLFGEIPSSLAKVPTLRVLSLSQNNLYGRIPKEIGGMVSLEQLDLSYNKLSGSIPQEIGGLRSLTILDLSWNGLQGELPYSLGQLQHLEKIDFSSNKLQGRVPQDVGHLKELVLLDFSHNLLTGPIPETLSGLQKLEYLIIEDNPINSGLPLFIGRLKKLKVLSFSGCGLTGPLLTSLSHLDGLIALSLDNNNLSDTVTPALGMLPNLDHLNLSHNFLTGEVSLPEGFINRLGKRLDLGGNVGLCTRQKFKKTNKMSPSFLQTPSCLETRGPAALDHSNNIKKVKPVWYQDSNMSSGSGRLDHQSFEFGSTFLVCFLISLI
ncbi:hypothetical protein DCAR_0104143 [Daucus carota subsp. sativus]|uniref:Disease resistance R13L4/SHOC-2-like LRR domain-containing protein n=2 Tax=Daucus carota subsp. sativus TaxID=79200 RepID=A0AAF0W8C4_DAUCS|nr:PREDICTED: piriformospora indica-insensitive protein 2-like [Daucus carota subsp. sativus]WOG84957.1 hypothetical protein DCAR_0104143 [Daucus carota subsp. sativus]